MEIPETDLVAIAEREVIAAAKEWADVSQVVGKEGLSPDEEKLFAAVSLLESREQVREEAEKRDRLLAIML